MHYNQISTIGFKQILTLDLAINGLQNLHALQPDFNHWIQPDFLVVCQLGKALVISHFNYSYTAFFLVQTKQTSIICKSYKTYVKWLNNIAFLLAKPTDTCILFLCQSVVTGDPLYDIDAHAFL